MNFFRRRKILRSTSFLDLTPVRVNDHEHEENGLVVLIVPKFKSTKLRRFMVPGTKSGFFKIKLDELGSNTWLAMDGSKNVRAICDKLIEDLGEKIKPHEEVEKRVMKFLSQLYDQRYITFREIQDN